MQFNVVHHGSLFPRLPELMALVAFEFIVQTDISFFTLEFEISQQTAQMWNTWVLLASAAVWTVSD